MKLVLFALIALTSAPSFADVEVTELEAAVICGDRLGATSLNESIEELNRKFSGGAVIVSSKFGENGGPAKVSQVTAPYTVSAPTILDLGSSTIVCVTLNKVHK